MIESENDINKLSDSFLKNRLHFELYIAYISNRQYSESTLNSFDAVRSFFNVNLIFFQP